jgi:hypothetical protein
MPLSWNQVVTLDLRSNVLLPCSPDEHYKGIFSCLRKCLRLQKLSIHAVRIEHLEMNIITASSLEVLEILLSNKEDGINLGTLFDSLELPSLEVLKISPLLHHRMKADFPLESFGNLQISSGFKLKTLTLEGLYIPGRVDDSESFLIDHIPDLVELKLSNHGEMEKFISCLVDCLVSRTTDSEGESVPTQAQAVLPKLKRLDIFTVSFESFILRQTSYISSTSQAQTLSHNRCSKTGSLRYITYRK